MAFPKQGNPKENNLNSQREKTRSSLVQDKNKDIFTFKLCCIKYNGKISIVINKRLKLKCLKLKEKKKLEKQIKNIKSKKKK